MKKYLIYNILASIILTLSLIFPNSASAFDLSKFWNDLLQSTGWGQAGKGQKQINLNSNLANNKDALSNPEEDESKLNIEKFKLNDRCNRQMYFPFGQPAYNKTELNQRSLFFCRLGYAMQYDPQSRSPVWVAFVMNPDDVKKWPSYKRGYNGWEDEPHRDPELPLSIQSSPAAMFSKNYLWAYLSPLEYEANPETDSQKSEMINFNEEQRRVTTVLPWVRGGQAMIEKMYAHLRTTALKSGVLHIVDGPLYLGARPLDVVGAAGAEQLVPSHMFVVVTIRDSFSSYGFIIPNNAQALKGHELKDFGVNIKEIERLTNINFHSVLQPYEEKKLEGSVTKWEKP